MPLQIVQRVSQSHRDGSLQTDVQALARIGVTFEANLGVAIELFGKSFDLALKVVESLLRIQTEQPIVERNHCFVGREAQLSAQRRLIFELAAVLQSRAKDRAQSFPVRTVKLALLTKEQTASILGLID